MFARGIMHLETTWISFWPPYTTIVSLSSPKIEKKIVDQFLTIPKQ